MPLKAIREVTACFVDPPVLETTIGSRTNKIRSEDDVWELRFLHILAEVGGLLTTGQARRWRLAPAGHTFLDTPSLFQVSFLLSVWWHRVNWLVPYPFTGMGEALHARSQARRSSTCDPFRLVRPSHSMSSPRN